MSIAGEHPEENCTEIELDKLVPFKNYPFQKYKGQEYLEVLESIKNEGIHLPLIVRPVAEDKYEILDGYYRIAAANELGLAKVPVLILEGMTNEEAISLVTSKISPFGLLVKYNIDIFKVGYKETKNYLKIKDNPIFSYVDGFMSYEEVIERFFLSEDEVKKSYKSIYEMGNPHVLNAEECEYASIAHDILTITNPEYVDYVRVLELTSTKGYNGRVTPENAMKDVESSIKELVNSFIRKGGYIDQLKKHLKTDLNYFDNEDIRIKGEKAKILYFLYMLKNKEFPNANILSIFSKPSMENIDNSYLGWNTHNEKIIHHIKSSIEKELSLRAKTHIKNTIAHIFNAWDIFLVFVRNDPVIAFENGNNDFVKELLETISHIPKLDESLSHEEDIKYRHSPIETLYLKLLQHEQTGRILDIMNINRTMTNTMRDVSSEFIDEMIKFNEVNVNVDDVEKYIYDNAFELAKYVYLTAETSKENRRTIRKCSGVVHNFLKFSIRAAPLYNAGNCVSVLTIISCLQVVISYGEELHFKNSYYGSQGNKDARKSSPHWRKVLRSGNADDDATQVFIVSRVVDQWYANIGGLAKRNKRREIENACDNALLEILDSSNMYEMLKKHNYYMEIIFGSFNDIIKVVNRFEKHLLDKGFVYIDIKYEIKSIFPIDSYNEQVLKGLTSMVDETINSKETVLQITNEIPVKKHDVDDEITLKTEFNLLFDYEYNVCTFVP